VAAAVRLIDCPSAWSVVVAMPAHNEECLGEFLREVEEHVRPIVARLSFVVVDDASDMAVETQTLGVLSRVDVLTNGVNRGHGPSVLRAYRQAVAMAPDVVVHVDGDGQFLGSDFPFLLRALVDRDGAVGRRVSRDDPWFRKVLSLGLRVIAPAGSDTTDVNTPLRAYRLDVIRDLLSRVPDDSLVPHVHWSFMHRRLHLRMAEVPVTSLPRRGASNVGTSWRTGRGRSWMPTTRLVRFAARALLEVLRGPTPGTVPATPMVASDAAA
jgi:dolichol-phosphate mannosyltransferase